MKRSREIFELAKLFLKLGTIGFGGPAAHLAMMRTEVVEKRGWLQEDEFLDLVSAANFIPGPNSTEVAIHIGYKRAGFVGLLVAGTCFILPAAFIVTLIARTYVAHGRLPEFQSALIGIKAVVIAVIFQAVWMLSRSALKNNFLIAIGALALAGALMGYNELVIIFVSGLLSLGISSRFTPSRFFTSPPLFGVSASALPSLTDLAHSSHPLTQTNLFLFFLKVGSVLFGSGYVLVAFLKADLVDRWQWLSQSQLLDAVAVGQITPGPVFTTATFIGYILNGYRGATLATLGIFLPAFVFVALSAPLIPKLRTSQFARAALDGLNVGSLAVMVSAGVMLAKDSIRSGPAVLIAFVSLIALIKFKVNSALLIIAGGIFGYFVF